MCLSSRRYQVSGVRRGPGMSLTPGPRLTPDTCYLPESIRAVRLRQATSTNPHRMDLPRVADVGERICVEHEQIGVLTGGNRTELLLYVRRLGGATRRRDQRLHRREARLHHLFELDMLEVTLPLALIGAGIRAECDGDTGIRECLEILAALLERRLRALRGLILLDLLLVGRILQLRDLVAVVRRGNVACEKRIVEVGRIVFVDELRDVTRQRRDVLH